MDKKCPVCGGDIVYYTGNMVKYGFEIPQCNVCGYTNLLDWIKYPSDTQTHQD